MEDRINKQDFVNALYDMYFAGRGGRAKIGQKARKHVVNNFNFENFNKGWVDLMLSVHENYGSWDSRKNNQNWRSESL